MNKRIVFNINERGRITRISVSRPDRLSVYINVRESYNPAFARVLYTIMNSPSLCAKVSVVPAIGSFRFK